MMERGENDALSLLEVRVKNLYTPYAIASVARYETNVDIVPSIIRERRKSRKSLI